MGIVSSGGRAVRNGLIIRYGGPAFLFLGSIFMVMVLVVVLLINGGVTGGAKQFAQSQDCSAGGSGVDAGSSVDTADAKSGTIPKDYEKDVAEAVKTSGIPESKLAAQIEAESAWNPKAGSPAGAQGIAQFMPSTFATYGAGGDIWNPHDSIKAQGRYMAALMKVVKPVADSTGVSQTDLAFAAYNAGEGAVLQYNGIPPYSETQTYVKTINAGAKKYEAGAKKSKPTAEKASDVREITRDPIVVQDVVEKSSGGGKARIDSGERLQKDAFQLAKSVQDQFPELKSIGGWRPSDPIAQDHPNGQAVDLMIPNYSSAESIKLGTEINHYVWKNRDRFHVTYSIWRQHLYNTGADKAAYQMEDRGSDTQNHFDHVHVTVEGHGPNDGTSGEIPKRDGSGTKEGSSSSDEGGDGSCGGSDSGSGIAAAAGNETSYGDNLPWGNKNLPHCNISAGYTCPEGSVSITGMYNYECTDWGVWVINRNAGVRPGQRLKYTNSNFRPDGVSLGTADAGGTNWWQAWKVKGWPTGKTPRKGAIVYYASGAGLAGPMGHIASVKEVRKDGTYIEEGYNGNPPPEDHKYYTRQVKNTDVTQFLYMPEKM